jgi:hypothetical protein
MGEKKVQLPEIYWCRILNLLTEELDVWERTSQEYKQLQAIIFQIKKQSGIKPRPEVEKVGGGKE